MKKFGWVKAGKKNTRRKNKYLHFRQIEKEKQRKHKLTHEQYNEKYYSHEENVKRRNEKTYEFIQQMRQCYYLTKDEEMSLASHIRSRPNSVAFDEKIPLEKRLRFALVAFLRHQATEYDLLAETSTEEERMTMRRKINSWGFKQLTKRRLHLKNPDKEPREPDVLSILPQV